MADKADIANELIEMTLEGALASRLQPTAWVASNECEECGELIPDARRQAAPWAATCIECQSIREQQAKGYRHAR